MLNIVLSTFLLLFSRVLWALNDFIFVYLGPETEVRKQVLVRKNGSLFILRRRLGGLRKSINVWLLRLNSQCAEKSFPHYLSCVQY